MNLDLIDKSDTHRILNRQSKSSFDGKIANNEKFILFSFNEASIKFTKPLDVGFRVLDLSKLLIYDWYCDEMQPYFGEHNLDLHYMDTDAYIFFFKPIKVIIEDLKHFRKDFDFSDLEPSHELYSEENKKSCRKNEFRNSSRIRFR